jgi:hypothetical protein
VSELSETARQVLQSLQEKPTLNTPSLIAMGPVVPDSVEKAEIEAALEELIEAGEVKHNATGWKLAG